MANRDQFKTIHPPFYGFLGENNALSIPRGWGAYQQILLDTTNLNAFGVGNYYVATELELRSALVLMIDGKTSYLNITKHIFKTQMNIMPHFLRCQKRTIKLTMC